MPKGTQDTQQVSYIYCNGIQATLADGESYQPVSFDDEVVAVVVRHADGTLGMFQQAQAQADLTTSADVPPSQP